MTKDRKTSIPSSSTSSSESISMTNSVEKKPMEREGWKGTLDFILTCIGYAVGLGNIWRFPYLCYKSGGGAFFIPYVLFLCLCGIPLFFMETVYGQFSSLSPIAIWNICPMFKGVGIGMVIVSGLVCVYYNVIVAWTLYYLFMSFRAVLPWSTCGNWWNTENCMDVENSVSMVGNQSSVATNVTRMSVMNGTSLLSNASSMLNYTMIGDNNTVISSNKINYISSSEEFWENHVLQLTDGIETIGTLRWQLVITLALAWVCVFFCLFKGVAVLGKVMHFCAPFPYLVLLVLLIRGVTLDGAIEGIKFYIIPQWDKLATFQVWGDAALQIFYSVGMAWGGIITMASYNDFKHNVYRDAMLVPFINCGTSIFAGFVIFSILGFMAHETGKSVEDVVKQGPGLTFVAYPEAVSMLPISPLWSVLFFLMLFIIGLDSQFGMFETCLSAFMDEFPGVLRKRRVLVSAVACFIEFLLGLPLITEGGIYILQIIDWYCASFSLMLISLTECLAIGWVYGVDRFYKDIELMIGFQPMGLWKYMWKFVTPLVILFIWLFSIITLGPVTYGEVTYPQWAVTFGWCLGMVSLVPIPACAIYSLFKSEGTLLQRFRSVTKPSEKWGPCKDIHRQEYLESLEQDKHALPLYQTNVVKRNVNTSPEERAFLS
ncbi:hypothetical protein ACF0H5_010797 [Mactra antiquata]